MNSALTTSLLKPANSFENNELTSSGGIEGSEGELFEGEFSLAMKDALSEDGNVQPLDVAALKELSVEDLTELEALPSIQLLPEVVELKPQSTLNILTDEKIESIDLFGNPDANALLKTNLIDEDLLKESTLNKGVIKSEILAAKTVMDASQQSTLKKDVDLSNVLDDISFSQNMKESGKNNFEGSSELLANSGKQEVNTSKIIEQLASIDKPMTTINSVSNNSIKSYSNSEQSAMMNRIEVPVTQSGWGEAVGNRLMMMVNGKMQSANIHLNPAELGPIEIRINVNQEQASVHFVSNNPAVREAIEDAFPRLKEMFSQNGLSLADTNVSQQSSQQGSQHTSEQNSSLVSSNNESLEIDDVQAEEINENMIDIGLVDQYV